MHPINFVEANPDIFMPLMLSPRNATLLNRAELRQPLAAHCKAVWWSRLRVNGGHSDYVGGRSGVPKIADDLLHGTKSSASGPTAAVTIDGVSTADIEGTADQWL